MSHQASARAAARRRRSTILAVIVIVAATLFGYQSLETSSSSAATLPLHAAHVDHSPGEIGGDGEVPDGVTVFDDHVKAVTRLQPDLLRALRRAATSAAPDGVTFHVSSGWRSRAYQERLLSQAIAKYGSKEEAARWVATPDTSPHVSGDAIDIGGADAMAWLSRHGRAYGLCQIYANEPWHYELRPKAVAEGCPPMYADPTHDPRMQQ